MSNPLVSIVIPAYNVEAYLFDCLESAAGQDYSRIEVIVVNDGSTDGCGNVIRRFMSLDHRVTCIETSNQGLSSARNLGLEKARGKYVMFLDGDDYLELNAVSRCLEVMTLQGADMVLFSARPFDDGSCQELRNYSGLRDSRLVEKIMPADIFLLRSLQFGNYIPSACLYVFDKSLVEKIRFLPGILHEDNLFTARVLLENRLAKVVAIGDALFNRRVRANSITTMKKTRAHSEGFFQVAEHLTKIELGRNEAGREAQSWLAQFALKEALSALRNATSVVAIGSRWRALNCLLGVPVRYWKARFLPFIILPELLAIRTVIAGVRSRRDMR